MLNIKYPCSLFSCFSNNSRNKKSLDNNYQSFNKLYVNRENHDTIKIQNDSEESDYYSNTEHFETEKVKIKKINIIFL